MLVTWYSATRWTEAMVCMIQTAFEAFEIALHYPIFKHSLQMNLSRYHQVLNIEGIGTLKTGHLKPYHICE